MLEREREAGAHDLDAVLEVAALRARDALQAQRAGAQVDPLGAHRLVAGERGELDRLAVPAGALQVGGDDEALARGLPGHAGRGEAVGGDPPSAERPLAVALERVQRREAPAQPGRVRNAGPEPCAPAGLAQRARRLGQVAASSAQRA